MPRRRGTGNSAANAVQRVEKQTRRKDCLYRPEFCQTVIKMGGSGASEAEMAVLGCGVVRGTMREWAKNIPEFKEALEMAREASLVWWEMQGRMRLRTSGFNTALYNKIVSCRFRGEYGEHLRLLGDEAEPVAIRSIRRVIVDPRQSPGRHRS